MKNKTFYLILTIVIFAFLAGCKKEETEVWTYEYELQEDDTYKIVKATADRYSENLVSDIIIPLTYKDKKVTTIGAGAFMNNVYFTDGWYPNLYIGENITKIEENAFNSLPVGNIEIKENVEVIEENAFYRCCYNYFYCFAESKPVGWSDDWAHWGFGESPTIFNYLEKRSNDMFDYVVLKSDEIVITYARAEEEYAHIIIPETIDGIPVTRLANTTFRAMGFASHFNYIEYVQEITLPETITVLEKSVFEHLDNLKTVSFSGENNITKIEENAFYYCNELENFVIGDEVVEIGENAFAQCLCLKNIIIPSNVAIIGESAFDYYSDTFIYCFAESKPAGWHEKWNDNGPPVIWGYIGE